eukprot:746522-Pyramimonas_sp.AAC.1
MKLSGHRPSHSGGAASPWRTSPLIHLCPKRPPSIFIPPTERPHSRTCETGGGRCPQESAMGRRPRNQKHERW